MRTAELKLKRKLNEVFIHEPNDLGLNFLTNLYKILTSPLKNIPFVLIVPLSFVFAAAIYVLFGKLIIKLVTLLQYGF